MRIRSISLVAALALMAIVAISGIALSHSALRGTIYLLVIASAAVLGFSAGTALFGRIVARKRTSAPRYRLSPIDLSPLQGEVVSFRSLPAPGRRAA
ncbi:hypothetical protein [Sphingomonas sp. 3-13AW]|uniref:hypothetical protein n=1 Tax=Sphingomonas sp. 3-13AW TaxID=3050450 RepID=UPI003BB590AB